MKVDKETAMSGENQESTWEEDFSDEASNEPENLDDLDEVIDEGAAKEAAARQRIEDLLEEKRQHEELDDPWLDEDE